MLKALELIGFKSFADKTRFEFPPGITVVVGPNGSGKSNVVDAIKWVLGEQSAKSLRGKDMSDVIFKGSGSGTRKVMNTAEATIIFDNSEGRLPVDAPEVHVTRRVYRSGEGEYLINRQPCRLKDIRDMFRGTGVGTDAYSLIEQGKVDRLLQASPRDRRAIFEEAAGISRFKAKKIEAQRRLERVDQNLLRLSDIVEEVESRLRSVRTQAGKARRYREYSERLQQLRTQVGLADWRQLTNRLEEIESELNRWRKQTTELVATCETLEQRGSESEAASERAADEQRERESRLASHREQIAARESTIGHHRARCVDLEEEAARQREHLLAMNSRAGDMQQRLDDTRSALAAAEAKFNSINSTLAVHEADVHHVSEQQKTLQSEHDEQSRCFVTETRTASTLVNEVHSAERELATLDAAIERCAAQRSELEQRQVEHAGSLRAAQTREQELTAEAERLANALASLRRELDTRRQQLRREQNELARIQNELSGLTQRAAVLEDLERRREGLSIGVKDVLTHAAEENPGAFQEVHGLVADVIRAPVEIASLVDAALGASAQHVIVSGERLIDEIKSGRFRPSGRVGFITLPVAETPPTVDEPVNLDDGGAADSVLPASQSPSATDLTLAAGVIGRASRLIETAPEYQVLASRLLDNTWFVQDLDIACALARGAGAGSRFVTLAGELLDADGTLVVGPRSTAVGLISRRSELRALHGEIEQLQAKRAEQQAAVAQSESDAARHESDIAELSTEVNRCQSALADERAEARGLEERTRQLEKQQQVLQAEEAAAQARRSRCAEQLQRAQEQAEDQERRVAELEKQLQISQQQLQQLAAEKQEHAALATAARIQLAKSEQLLDSLRHQKNQLEEHQRERTRAIADAQALLLQSMQRHQQVAREILQAESELAELYLNKDAVAGEIAQISLQREQLTAQRTAIAQEITSLRKQLQKLDAKQHEVELAAGEVRHQRATLVERLREDYGIEIDQLQQQTDTPEQEREAVENEIADLRRKINQIGAVNMDALNELDDLESRFNGLSSQYQDLARAKEALEKIIARINADSRRLFLETLEAIRANFQVLYRKAFGGGKADLVLEEGVDVLEAGVDILTTPPGKPQFDNSLLSGGEKALTAVSLLLAIFQFRPSPFCVLDEVDAPFDEANIGRFIDVLKDFLGWTKFVIVTHSKKTMTAATTLYGVTMQESGVSKQVSVRFDDVTEDGHIRAEAIERSAATPHETDAA